MKGDRHLRDVGSRFSSAAAHYPREAMVQARIAAAVLQQIPPSCDPRAILDLGCGTGGLTRLLHARWPRAHCDAVDIAKGMIAQARSTGSPPGVAWHVADGMSFTGSGAYGLVASSSALHWFVPFGAGLRHAAGLVAPGGWMSFALMLRGTLAELHDARRSAAPAKVAQQAMPEAAEVRLHLEAAGLEVAHVRAEWERDFHPDVDHVLHALHRMGVTGGALSRGAAPLTRSELADLKARYEAGHRDRERGIPVSYHVGYALARRP